MNSDKRDYSKTCIYKIVFGAICYYVGSTTNFTQRKSGHKSSCNNDKHQNHNYRIYKYMRENGWTGSFQKGGWDMILIEKFPCKDGVESSAREHYHYTLLNPSLNTNVPGRTPSQYGMQHYIDNPEHYKTKNDISNAIRKCCPYCTEEFSNTYLYRHIKICKSRPIELVVDSSATSVASASSASPTPDVPLV